MFCKQFGNKTCMCAIFTAPNPVNASSINIEIEEINSDNVTVLVIWKVCTVC